MEQFVTTSGTMKMPQLFVQNLDSHTMVCKYINSYSNTDIEVFKIFVCGSMYMYFAF